MTCDSTVPVIPISALYEILIAIRNTGAKSESSLDTALNAFLDGDIDQGKRLKVTALGSFTGGFPTYADFYRMFEIELAKAVKVIGWVRNVDQVIVSLARWNETTALNQMASDLVDEFDPKVNFTLLNYNVVLN